MWTKGASWFVEVALVCGLAAGASQTSAQIVRSRTGAISKFTAKDVIGSQDCTSETTFKQIPFMFQQFTLGGPANEEVVVMFEGVWEAFGMAAGTEDGAKIRLRIDGVVQEGPGQGVFAFRMKRRIRGEGQHARLPVRVQHTRAGNAHGADRLRPQHGERIGLRAGAIDGHPAQVNRLRR